MGLEDANVSRSTGILVPYGTVGCMYGTVPKVDRHRTVTFGIVPVPYRSAVRYRTTVLFVCLTLPLIVNLPLKIEGQYKATNKQRDYIKICLFSNQSISFTFIIHFFILANCS